ncbi:MAG TPA: M1 family metallopeptidase [Candidatus Polarisedimenticolia bacterium]|nr:M1 family metallopeptidase [Candidatus Polarisedimenticolia bacterium]
MRSARLRSALVLLFALALPSAPAFASGSGRLLRDVLPTAERLKLNLDARKKGYSGSASIDLSVKAATDSFQFHSEGLRLTRVTLRKTKAVVPSTHVQVATNVVTLRTRTPLKPGAYVMDIDFTNDFGTQAQGIYRLDTEGESYCFTQFESDDARKAFPCWDEPSFKIPYTITLTVPKTHRAVANTLIARTIPGKTTKTIVFHKTPPVPSYILAIATGPLEFVPIRGMSVPGNVVTAKGQSKLAAKAASMAPPILAALERYFGRPYPYEKLDVLAVPEFWPGAMENAGAVTFRDDVLLVDPKTVGMGQLSTLSVFMAHEFAHQWFGDLVTMDWWDDLWLNESFAEWMGNKISDEVNPEYNQHVKDLRETQRAMFTDSRLSTRAIRRPVSAMDNLLQAADDLAYKKGQSVIAMFEQWLGPETFRAGVIAYLKEHEWGNSVASDLWDALSKASGKDATAAMSTFLDQEGIPLVTADLLPDGRVKLSQKRFLSYGVAAPREQLWQIPVALSYSDGSKVQTQHVLLAGTEMTITLEGSKAPVWINPNAGPSGYYRWSVSSDMLGRLAQNAGQAMTPVERVGYLGNLSALLAGGQVHGDEYARLLTRFGDDESPEVVLGVVDGLAILRRVFVTPSMANPYAAYVRKTLGPALARFGLSRRQGEPVSVSLLRPSLVAHLADDGKDAGVLAYADSLAKQHIASPGTVDPSLIGVALDLSAMNGDEALFADYRKRFETAAIPAERSRYLSTLGHFRNPKIAQEAIRYSLEGPLRPQELFDIPVKQSEAFEYEDVPYRWMSENFGTIASKLPPMYLVYMPNFAGGCSTERLEKAKVFFSDPKHQMAGYEIELAKVTDQVNDCAGLRQREGALVSAYLSQQVGSR